MCASPQYEDGYTKIANEILDHLCSFRIPGEVRQVVDAIIRKTYGYGKKEDRVAHSQLLELTKQDKGNLSRSLSKAMEHKLVVKYDNKLAFNKDYEQWVPFVRVVISDKKESVVISATPVVISDNKLLSKVTDTIEKKETYTKEITVDGLPLEMKEKESFPPYPLIKKEKAKLPLRKNTKKEVFFPEFPDILLSKEEYDKLILRYGAAETRSKCEGLFLYMGSHGKKYVSHYLTILNWDRADKKRQPKQEEKNTAKDCTEGLWQG